MQRMEAVQYFKLIYALLRRSAKIAHTQIAAVLPFKPPLIRMIINAKFVINVLKAPTFSWSLDTDITYS